MLHHRRLGPFLGLSHHWAGGRAGGRSVGRSVARACAASNRRLLGSPDLRRHSQLECTCAIASEGAQTAHKNSTARDERNSPHPKGEERQARAGAFRVMGCDAIDCVRPNLKFRWAEKPRYFSNLFSRAHAREKFTRISSSCGAQKHRASNSLTYGEDAHVRNREFAQQSLLLHLTSSKLRRRYGSRTSDDSDDDAVLMAQTSRGSPFVLAGSLGARSSAAPVSCTTRRLTERPRKKKMYVPRTKNLGSHTS